MLLAAPLDRGVLLRDRGLVEDHRELVLPPIPLDLPDELGHEPVGDLRE